MRVIGLTGNIACGKTVVAKMFKELGAKVIDADQIAREIAEPGEDAWKEIKSAFGDEILKEDRTINRRKLGDIVFSDAEKRERLNRITHHRIIEKVKKLIDRYNNDDLGIVIIEAALIVEKGGLKNLIDDLIVVTADEYTQIDRIRKRDGLKKEDAMLRIKSQMPISQKIKHATYLVENSGTLNETRKQVEEIWEKIN